MAEKHKILFSGDVEGKFDTLFNRVANLNKKSGPFDCLFCVGNFFGINNKEFEAYKTGEKEVPIPTYILGPNDPDHVRFYPDDDSELCNNIYYLGRRGIFTNTKGLKVAYISGLSSKTSSPHEYTDKDLTELYNACIRGKPDFRGVDILLTSQWPSGVMRHDPKQISLSINKISDYPSWLVMKLKPRYHISGLEGIYYERSPFRCPLLGDHDTTLELATRFIALARVGNSSKDKWLFALNLTPLDKMKVGELLQKTTDETSCPYVFEDLQHKVFNLKRKVDSNQYFFDTTAPIEQAVTKHRKRAKMEFDQSKCWFCLASTALEKHLILAVGNAAYLALAKGGIVDEHFLICPIEHFQHSLSQSQEVKQEVDKFKQSLKKFYEATDKVPVFFERNYKTSHMQLQVVPLPKQACKELREIFIEEAEGHGVNLQILDSDSRLDQVLQANVPFFVAELPDGTVLYSKIKGNQFPLNFAREILATGPLLNVPNRSDWKDCILSREQEDLLMQKLRSEYKPFDFTE